MRILSIVLACSLTACATSVGNRSDVVIQWNQQVLETAGDRNQHMLAIVHLAMFDAANAIDRRYASYLSLPPPPAGMSADAAAASAAHGVLVRLFPGEHDTLAAALRESLTEIADGRDQTTGIDYGDLVARRMCENRITQATLGSDDSPIAGTAPGDYQFTEPMIRAATASALRWTPIVLESPSQFRPGPPPALSSTRYAHDLEEVRRVGGARTARTSNQTEIALWHTEDAAAQLNRLARSEAVLDGRGLVEHARLFAQLNVAIAEATLSAAEAQYVYRFWRPMTAIREVDFTARATQDRIWSPFVTTPLTPEYPADRVAVLSAAARVFDAYFGHAHPFRMTATTVPNVSRTYASFDAFAEESVLAGIFGGTQFRTSGDRGMEEGVSVGDWVLTHCLRPITRR